MLMYMVVVWWPRVCLATVRADLGLLQRVAQVSITVCEHSPYGHSSGSS